MYMEILKYRVWYGVLVHCMYKDTKSVTSTLYLGIRYNTYGVCMYVLYVHILMSLFVGLGHRNPRPFSEG